MDINNLEDDVSLVIMDKRSAKMLMQLYYRVGDYFRTANTDARGDAEAHIKAVYDNIAHRTKETGGTVMQDFAIPADEFSTR